MKLLEVKKGDMLVAKSDKVMEWYLIQKGCICQRFEMEEIELDANSIIGILENGFFICDYVAKEDSSLIVIDCKDSDDLQRFLRENPNFRALFLRSAITQRHKAFSLYSKLRERCDTLHTYAEKFYTEYEDLCSEFLIPSDPFIRIENFEPVQMVHQASDWEMRSSNVLVGTYFSEYMQLMMKDESLTVGAIMEAGAQTRRVTQGIDEMISFLLVNRDLLYSDTEDDVFHRIHSLAADLTEEGKSPERAERVMHQIEETMRELGIYTDGQYDRCSQGITSYQKKDGKAEERRFDITKTNCVTHIFHYAGFTDEEADEFKKDLDLFRETPDKSSLDNEAYAARRRITKTFYKVYYEAFMRSVKEEETPDRIIQMFLYFGFMDKDYLGEEHLNAVCALTDRISFFRSQKIFTVYDWLLRVYNGDEEPSISELDQNYDAYLAEQKKNGEISAEQLKLLKLDKERKVKFEIDNLFMTGHRVCYGRVTSFCPVLSGEDMITAIEKIAVTADRLKDAVNGVRSTDYSIFYREEPFSDPEHGINNEQINREILPNIILMPTVGSRAMMWQETSGIRSNTPARFVFPIFSSMDLQDAMLEVAARYRWEFCKHVMGARWNDIRDKSLTSEYSDYLQFYKKNHDLSVEAREKIKAQLAKGKNNYREVFVRDYVNWMRYESKGGFRLNRVARDILSRYCPFPAEVREQLISNPMFESAFRQKNSANLKAEQRLNSLYDKYEKAGGIITQELLENLRFYQM